MTTLIPKYHAFTNTQLLNAPAYGGVSTVVPGYPPPIPGYGVDFTNTDSAGTEQIYASIQGQTISNTAGDANGQLNVLIGGHSFLQNVSAWTYEGSFVTGPGAAPYTLDICGKQSINGLTPPGPIFGERLSVEDPDYADCRALAIRNVCLTDLTSLNYTSRIGFSILNTASVERPTAYFGAMYSTRTANLETSYLQTTLLRNGVETDGVAFTGSSVVFPATQIPETNPNALDDYEEGTWTPAFASNGTYPTVTYTQQIGQYTKIGRQVTVKGLIQATVTVSGSGYLRINNLPFAANASSDAVGSIGLNSIFNTGYAPSALHVESGGTSIRFYAHDSADARSPITTMVAADTATLGTGYVYFEVTYFV